MRRSARLAASARDWRAGAATPAPSSVARNVGLAIVVAAVALLVQSVVDWHPADRSASQLAFAAVALVLFVAAFGRIVWTVVGDSARPREQAAEIAICVSFSTAVLLSLGPVWSSLAALGGGAAVMALRDRRRLLVPVAMLGLTIASTEIHGADATVLLGVVVLQILTTVATGGLGLLALLAREVERARIEKERMLVVDERLALARNLHDVLGRSLSVISLKAEVAHLLFAHDPDKADREITEISEITRQSVTDLRSLVHGYRRMSVVDELEQVESTLALAGVRCVVDSVPPALPDRVQDAVGWLIREAGTNVVRHSRATTCTIRMRLVDDLLRLTVGNDGVPAPDPSTRAIAREGNGLAGLRERMAAVGGSVETAAPGDGTFTVRADIPVRFVGLEDTGRDARDGGRA